jgi:hypothetical protein
MNRGNDSLTPHIEINILTRIYNALESYLSISNLLIIYAARK